jgi:hypothetical protein
VPYQNSFQHLPIASTLDLCQPYEALLRNDLSQGFDSCFSIWGHQAETKSLLKDKQAFCSQLAQDVTLFL